MGSGLTDKKFVEANKNKIRKLEKEINELVISRSKKEKLSGFNLGVKIHGEFGGALATAVGYVHNIKRSSHSVSLPLMKNPHKYYGLKNLERIGIVLSSLDVSEDNKTIKGLKELYPDFKYKEK